jgi:hypothetical protein
LCDRITVVTQLLREHFAIIPQSLRDDRTLYRLEIVLQSLRNRLTIAFNITSITNLPTPQNLSSGVEQVPGLFAVVVVLLLIAAPTVHGHVLKRVFSHLDTHSLANQVTYDKRRC